MVNPGASSGAVGRPRSSMFRRALSSVGIVSKGKDQSKAPFHSAEAPPRIELDSSSALKSKGVEIRW